jgi:hypothetical protein
MTVLYIVVALVAYYLLTSKKGPKADYSSFLKYVNFRLGKGKEITKDDVDNVEQFSLAMGIPFTAREQAAYLAETTPKKVKKLREKADKAKKLWNKLSKTSKYLAYVAAIVVFGILYNNWIGPLWDMLVTSTQFVWGVLKSVPQSVLAAVPFVIFLYVAKKLADYRKKLYKQRAAAVESTIPTITKVYNILNQG